MEQLVRERAKGGRGTGALGRPDEVVCIVLGRGADDRKVLHWLEQGAGVPGYAGFAVGRTLWWDALIRHVAGETDGAQASAEIAGNYRRLVYA